MVFDSVDWKGDGYVPSGAIGKASSKGYLLTYLSIDLIHDEPFCINQRQRKASDLSSNVASLPCLALLSSRKNGKTSVSHEA